MSSVRDTAICAACAVGCYRMFLCCCWPVHKCATVRPSSGSGLPNFRLSNSRLQILSVFDTLIVSVFFYNVLKNVAKGHTSVVYT